MDEQDRLKIYKKMLELAIEDVKISLNLGIELWGLCALINLSTGRHDNIENYPELIEFKPNDTYDKYYWFSPIATKNNVHRIDILKKIIKNMEKDLEV